MADDPLDDVLPLSPTLFHMLVSMSEGPKHGYAVAQEVESSTDGRIVLGPGTLYGSLQRMSEQGLIEEAENPGDEGIHADRRRYYRVTALGRSALRADARRMLDAVRAVEGRLGT